MARGLVAIPLIPILGVLAGCHSASDSFPVAAAGGAPTAYTSQTDYRILPQDIVEIAVYQVPSLNRSAQVDGNGRLSLPLIGTVMAGGRTTREIEADITARLGAKYIQSPQVAVTVRDGVGQRVTVDGAVKRPGVVSTRGETTLLQVLAQAGGLDEVGDSEGVTVFRVVNQQRTGTPYDLNAIRSGRAIDPPIYGGDTVIVGESATRNAWKMVKDIAPIGGAVRVLVP